MIDAKLQMQEAQRKLSKINTKKSTHWHIVLKMHKITDKEILTEATE